MKSQVWACYEDYLKSPEWAKIRGMALDRAKHRCQVCNSDTSLQVHHRVYDAPWGEESTDDLTALCSSCHMLFHRNEARIKKSAKDAKKLANKEENDRARAKNEQARASKRKKKHNPAYAKIVNQSGGVKVFSKEEIEWYRAHPKMLPKSY